MAKKIYTSPTTGAKVYRDAANNEWYVIAEGQTKAADSTYYTSDKGDAVATADNFYCKTIQQILNIVIDSGHYQDTKHNESHHYKGSNYMCDSIGWALVDGIINRIEARKVKKAIREYIGNNLGLLDFLKYHKLPYEFKDRLAIYKDWENRPVVA